MFVLVQISKGKAALPIWKINPTNFYDNSRYTGNDTLTSGSFGIYDVDAIPNYPSNAGIKTLANIKLTSITFSKGSAKKSVNDGTITIPK